MVIAPYTGDPDIEQELRRLREAYQQRTAAEATKRFDVDAWLAAGPPATPEELADMEEFLRSRNEERERSLAREAGVG